MTRFSPTWWAAWTCALHRPGRYDDEEILEGVEGVRTESHGEGPDRRVQIIPLKSGA